MNNIANTPDPLEMLDRIQLFQGTDDGSPAVISRKIATVAPDEEFKYTVVAVGEGPCKIEIKNLPAGLTYSDKAPHYDLRIVEGKPAQIATTGMITGKFSGTSDQVFTITAMNVKGSVTESITVRPKAHILPTPPMGWLSWEWFREGVSQEGMKKVIDAMAKHGLAKYGWKYVVIDDCWQGERSGDGPLPTNEKFPDMRELSDYARENGFILGIYSNPWTTSYAGYPSSGHHEAADVKQFAEWNIGYLKIDYRPSDVKYLSFWQDLLKESGTDIAYSFSNHGLYDWGQDFLNEITDVWRTGTDIFPKWDSIYRSVYPQYLDMEGWKHLRKGHWPDPDMLQIGMQREGIEMPENEQHFQMSIWAILPAPLLLSCDVENLSEFHLSLMTAEEVIAVNQDILGLPAMPVSCNKHVLAKPLSDGTIAVGFFNTQHYDAMISVSMKDLGLEGPQPIRDLWEKKDLGEVTDVYSAPVKSHSAKLFKVGKPKK